MKRLSLLPGTVVTAAILSTLISCPQGLINNPKLSAFPHRGPAPLTVDFKVYQADDYEAFEWIPGDGTRLIATDSDTFTHIYESPGTYYACCFTYDNESPDFDDGSYAIITVTEPGFAASIETESVDAEYCYTPEGFQVVFSSSVSGGEPPYTYSWDFGDGVRSSSEDNPMYHQYFPEVPGESYTVRLRVTDSTTAVVDSNEITIDVNECAVVGL
jgi:PKD repeat protein